MAACSVQWELIPRTLVKPATSWDGELMYRLSDGFRITNSEDGAVVLHIDRGRVFKLNPTGSKVLEMLGSGSSEDEVVDELSREFNECQKVVAGDIRKFIVSLQEHQLIERCWESDRRDGATG